MWDSLSVEDQDVIKANLCLAGIIGIFLALTLLAYLLTEGRSYCVIPLLRMTCPQCTWVRQFDENKGVDYQKLLILQVELTQHVLGVKRSS